MRKNMTETIPKQDDLNKKLTTPLTDAEKGAIAQWKKNSSRLPVLFNERSDQNG